MKYTQLKKESFVIRQDNSLFWLLAPGSWVPLTGVVQAIKNRYIDVSSMGVGVVRLSHDSQTGVATMGRTLMKVLKERANPE